MDSLSYKLLEALEDLTRNRKMTVNLIKKLLKVTPRPSNIISYKFLALKWFTSKRCRFIYGSESYSTLPEDWITRTEFSMLYMDKKFYVSIVIEEKGIAVDMTYRTPRMKVIRKGVCEFNDSIPDVQNMDLSTSVRSIEKDHLVWCYNQIVYEWECTFWRLMLHCFTNGEEPRSTPGTPAVNYGTKRKHNFETEETKKTKHRLRIL